MCLVVGAGTAMDVDEGEASIRKAADQDEPTAEFLLGHYYEVGIGMPADPVESVNWYRLSAVQGLPKAQLALAQALAAGIGIKPDLVEAYKWYMLVGRDPAADAATKSKAADQMLKLIQNLTPEQVKEAGKRADEFVPKSNRQSELLSFGLS